ncbi:protein kinase STUNTED-like isoform X2 [Amaranthus tricolor]|uniref:protein kinase STUNTED-like isoform X2 n=1 Tax=Amaranthus tricolor TaxID=29722 RepID=UPI00258C9A9C|nr:protein kinase STUNTED-like isoform X2 [Amaranthus tricolor]
MKMIWDFGFGCFVPSSYTKEEKSVKNGGKIGHNLEHNKAWLLAESGGDLANNGEPHSVHSSFRFSICSQVEIDSMKSSNFAPSTTILMVNLDNNVGDAISNELNWRRIESLEKNISLVANSLIRFSYGEIVSATRNFSEGKKRGMKGFASLSWSARYKVAVGIGEAIAYLHNGTEKCIVHRDIKPSNILLSSKKRPKLCDFGLATWTPAPSVPFLCKTVKGTFGYLAPEYFQHGKVSDKTDVYAFGVVLLELITGRKPIEATRPPGEENLVQWAKPLMDKGDSALDGLLDPRAKFTPKSSKLITQMVRAASACVNTEESSRPGINEAIILLRGESCLVKGKAGFGSRNSYAPPILQRTKSEMNSHFALAMLGVTELDDDDFLYGR